MNNKYIALWSHNLKFLCNENDSEDLDINFVSDQMDERWEIEYLLQRS